DVGAHAAGELERLVAHLLLLLLRRLLEPAGHELLAGLLGLVELLLVAGLAPDPDRARAPGLRLLHVDAVLAQAARKLQLRVIAVRCAAVSAAVARRRVARPAAAARQEDERECGQGEHDRLAPHECSFSRVEPHDPREPALPEE